MDKTSLLLRKLKHLDLTLALAESVTGGLAAHKLCGRPGTSAVLKGAIVCYNAEVKTGLLGISEKLIAKHTAESMKVTKEMAKKLRRLIDADIHAAITGLDAPGGTETKAKPVGTIFFCFRYKRKYYKFRKVFRGTPLQIREKCCEQLYDLILEKVSV